MLFKPVKSKCVVVRKGTVTDMLKLTNNTNRWFDSTLSDKNSLHNMTASWKGLRRIDKSELSRT